MNDGNKSFTNTRMELVAIFAAIAAVFAFINWLPIEKPFFLAEDSEIRASRLLRDGDCNAGYAIYEKRAAKRTYDVSWLTVGRMKYLGECRGQDLPGAIVAYRKAAQNGACRANFNLAGIAYLHPEIPGFKQADYQNNLFAVVMCAFYTNNEKLIEQYIHDEFILPGFEILEPSFRQALERRKEYSTLSPEAQKKIVSAIINGDGYDANPDAKP